MNRLLILIFIASVLALTRGVAQEIDVDIRENPDLESAENSVVFESVDLASYPFLRLDENRISLNGDNWDSLAQMMRTSGDTVVSILHIGDSHVQAEGSTSRVRSLLQQAYGSAGRGLILPFRIAGTNQPTDYKITSPSKFTSAKLMKQPWPVEMGFTGLALQPSGAKFSFTIEISRRPGSEPDFDLVKMLVKGSRPKLVSAKDSRGVGTIFSDYPTQEGMDIFIFEPDSAFTLEFASTGKCQILGFLLENQMTGVQYSAIGHNGATYSAYNTLGCVGEECVAVRPALVIISLGTNEAFGNTSAEGMYANIGTLVSNIKRNNPDAKILLTTPAECQRSKWVRSGKKRRRKRTYSVNAKVAVMRDAILKYGKENGVPTYDMYAVAGGQGASDRWLKADLLRNDRIHNTNKGYALKGTLLFNALQEAITASTQKPL